MAHLSRPFYDCREPIRSLRWNGPSFELDLIERREAVSLLCETCATALENVGKLARPRTPANRAHRNLLDPIEHAFRAERGWE